MHFAEDSVTLTLRARRSDATETLQAQRVLSATGQHSANTADSALVRTLCRRGLARLDPWSFGLDVTPSLEVRDASGQPDPGLRALGPIVRGVFWECIAVPDLRVQAQQAAHAIAASIGRPAVA